MSEWLLNSIFVFGSPLSQPWSTAGPGLIRQEHCRTWMGRSSFPRGLLFLLRIGSITPFDKVWHEYFHFELVGSLLEDILEVLPYSAE